MLAAEKSLFFFEDTFKYVRARIKKNVVPKSENAMDYLSQCQRSVQMQIARKKNQARKRNE